MIRKFAFVSILLMLSLSCGQETPEVDQTATEEDKAVLQPVDGGSLVSITGPIETLNFLESYDTDQLDIVYLIADSLVSFGRDLTIVPRLAERWEISEDHKTLTFYLHPEARFHDGTPLTADDVVFTYDESLDPDILWGTYRSNFELIDSIQAKDPHTVVVQFKEAVANPLTSFVDFFILPKHLYDRSDVSLQDNPVNWKPVGSGPYRLVKWEKNIDIVLEANDDYFNGRPHLDRIVFKIVNQNAMLFDMLMNGELDLSPISTMEWQFRTGSEEFRSRFQKRKYFLLAFFFTGWNHENRFFRHRNVRQAMAYLCDRKSFNDATYFSQYRIAASPVHPESPFFNHNVRPFPFDPATALRLLKEAGIEDRNNDGRLEDQDGVPFEFDYMVATGEDRAARFAEFYQSTLADHGIQMNIVQVDMGRFQEQTNAGNYDAYFRGWITGVDPDFLISIFRTPGETESYNDTGYSNPELDRILDLSDKELDPEARMDLFLRAQEIIHEDQPYLFLFYPAALVAVHSRFRALQPSARGIFRWYPGIQGAFVPMPLQSDSRDER